MNSYTVIRIETVIHYFFYKSDQATTVVKKDINQYFLSDNHDGHSDDQALSVWTIYVRSAIACRKHRRKKELPRALGSDR